MESSEQWIGKFPPPLERKQPIFYRCSEKAVLTSQSRAVVIIQLQTKLAGAGLGRVRDTHVHTPSPVAVVSDLLTRWERERKVGTTESSHIFGGEENG